MHLSLCARPTASHSRTHTHLYTHSFTVTHPPGHPPYPISTQPPHTPNNQSVNAAAICCPPLSLPLSFFLFSLSSFSASLSTSALNPSTNFSHSFLTFLFSSGKSHPSLLHPSPSQGSSKPPWCCQFLCNRSHGCGGNSPAMQHSYKIAAAAMGAAAETKRCHFHRCCVVIALHWSCC